MMRKIIVLLSFLATANVVLAQSYLVPRSVINQKIQDGYFMQRMGTTITNDNMCMTAAEAKASLYLDESKMPADSRMPWWSELVPLRTIPCTTANTRGMCPTQHADYSACGAYIYTQGFNNSITSFKRDPVPGAFWTGTSTSCGITPVLTAGTFATAVAGARTAAVGDSGLFIQSMDAAAFKASQSASVVTPFVQAAAAATLPGPMNRAGMWLCGAYSTNTWYVFSRTINVPATKTYYMGIGARDYFSFYLDNFHVMTYNATTGRSTEAYKIWHIFPIQIGPGIHTLYWRMLSTNGTVPAYGIEFYDNTPAEIMAATSYSNLKVIFSTNDTTKAVICNL